MPEGKTLVSASPGAGLPRCIDRFISSLREDPLRTWMILPTKRLIRTVRQRLSDEKITYIPDQICTLDQFCAGFLVKYGETRGIIAPQAARILLSNILREKKDELPLFFASGKPSPQTLQDLQTLISVITRRMIAYPECLGDLQTEKSAQIQIIIRSYLEHLSAEHLVDSDGLLSWFCTCLSRLSDQILGSVYIYGLFEPLPLEKEVILAIANAAADTWYILPAGDDPDIFSDTGAWIHPDCRETIASSEKEVGRTGIFIHEPGRGQKVTLDGIFCSGYSDPIRELRGIAEEIIRLHTGGVSYDQIAIAFPDLRYALSYADEIFSDYGLPYHSSSSHLLTLSPLTQFCTQVFEFVEKGFRYEELMRMLQSPYLRFSWTDEGGETRSFWYEKFDLICRTYGITRGFIHWEEQLGRIRDLIADEEIGSERVSEKVRYGPKRPLPREEIRQTLDGFEHLLSIFRLMGGKKSITDHIRVYKKVLARIGAPVPDAEPSSPDRISLSREECGDLKSFNSVLDELLRLSRSGMITGGLPEGEVSFSRFLYLLRVMLQDQEAEPGTGEEGILLCGIRETVHLRYPYLFLASLNEGMIPRLTTRLPFTNARESSRMDTRSLSDILRHERYQFIAALLAGETVYMSYHEHRDERSTLTSPFLDHMLKIADIPSWSQESPSIAARSLATYTSGRQMQEGRWDKALSCLPGEFALASLISRITIERNARFRLNRSEYDGILSDEPDVRNILKTQFHPGFIWSASMLESYAKCPFRFYMERVIRIRPLPELGDDISPVERGNLIHSVLCRFKRRMLDAGMFPLTEERYDEAVSVIHDLADEEFLRVPYQTPLWQAKKKQLLGGDDIGLGIFERFVAAEVERLSPDESGRCPRNFIPRYFEFSFGAVPGPDDDPASSPYPVDLGEIAKDLNGEDICDSVLFSGKIDRVDMSSDGIFGVVDYKTGIKVPSTADLLKGTTLQLPLYIHAFQRISGHAGMYGSYCHIQRSIQYSVSLCDPLIKEELPNGKVPRGESRWKEIMEMAVRSSCAHVRAIQQGIFPINASSSCSPDWYCPYAAICRFQPDRGSRLGEWIDYPPRREE